MHRVKGGCHCGNISYVAEFPSELHSYMPRACDCRLCRSHGAEYASDKLGSLSIRIKQESEVSRYRQGSEIADFLVCKNCGVMTGVCYGESGLVYGSINIRSSDEYASFREGRKMALARLSDDERVKLWKENWFQGVVIESENA